MMYSVGEDAIHYNRPKLAVFSFSLFTLIIDKSIINRAYHGWRTTSYRHHR